MGFPWRTSGRPLLAMIRAVDRFDPEAGVTFSTFASRTVDGELKRWFRDKAWMVPPAPLHPGAAPGLGAGPRTS